MKIRDSKLLRAYAHENMLCEISSILDDPLWNHVRRTNQHARLETHHIFGGPNRSDVRSNLIRISNVAHGFIHNHRPIHGKVACLWAKWQKSRSEVYHPIHGIVHVPKNEFLVSEINGFLETETGLLGWLYGAIDKIKDEPVYSTKLQQLIAFCEGE